MTISAGPQLEARAPIPYVSIPVQATFQEWNRTIEKIPQLFAWLGEHGITSAGALFYRYRVLGDEREPSDVEVGIAVSEPVQASAPVIAGEIPGGTYLTCVHHGHPDRLFSVHEELESFAHQRNIEFDTEDDAGNTRWAGRFEYFLTRPEEEPNPDNWFIEVALLVTGDQAAGSEQ